MTNSKTQNVRPPTVWDVRKGNLGKGKLGGFVSTSDREINIAHVLLLLITTSLAIVGLIFVRPKLITIIWGILMYFWTGMGITGGYHRLWSHRAYSASWPVRFFLCLGGAAAFQGSAKWWCRNHRAHHRYTDTDKDPYNARRGFFYAHMGWILVKQNTKKIGFADITDLQKDKMIIWQHNNYATIALVIGVVFPTLVAGLWGDLMGGFFYASMLRIVIVHHATFFVNSLAHYFGDKSFSDHHTAFDSFITAILTLGEGYHNYHHEFPQDYRNGIKFYQYDPTKWMIRGLNFLGLTYDLNAVKDEEIIKARIQMEQRRLDWEKIKIQPNVLPSMTWKQIKAKIEHGESLLVIDKIVLDVTSFVHEHPGGRQTLLNWVGTDATNLFNGLDGSDHVHSKNARIFLQSMRVGHLMDE